MSVVTDDAAVKNENGLNDIHCEANSAVADQKDERCKINERSTVDGKNPKIWDVQASPIEIMKLENKFKVNIKNVESDDDISIKNGTRKNKSDKNKEEIPKNASKGPKKINISRFMGETCCKKLCHVMDMANDFEQAVEDKTGVEKPTSRVTMPSLEDLPNDEDELEDMLKKWISDMKPSWRRHKSGKPYPPGTMGSAMDVDYRLSDIVPGTDPAEAVTGGKVECGCGEEITVDGETDTLEDIENKMDELKTNHKTTRVIVRIKRKKAVIKDKVSTKSDAMSYRGGPPLLTKYCMERVCEGVGSHPKLTSLRVEGLPLSQPYRAMLVPSFATLRELSLISTKLGDNGLKLICRYAWRSPSLRVLDLTDNGIRLDGVKHLTQMLQRRGVIRTEMEDFFGVERITLDKNPIGYDGFKELLNSLSEDFYLKALDLRDCDLRRGDEEALRVVSTHRGIEVLDLRGNNLRLAGDVMRTVMKNCPPDRARYKWRDAQDLENYSKTEKPSLPILILNSE